MITSGAGYRYVQNCAYFLQHLVNRLPPKVPVKPVESVSRKKPATKAIVTRKARYGDTKMKRTTREGKESQGHKRVKGDA